MPCEFHLLPGSLKNKKILCNLALNRKAIKKIQTIMQKRNKRPISV